MRKGFLLAVGLVLALTWATPAYADLVEFDPSGTAGADEVDAQVFDWAPGNAMIVDNGDGTGTVYFQFNLGTLQDGGVVWTNGDDNNFFTAVGAFEVTFISGGFLVDAGSGTFNIYSVGGTADDLNGTGFTSGDIILTGSAALLNPGGGGAILLEDDQNLDQSPNGDQWGDEYLTYNIFFGSTTVRVTVDTFDDNYFLNLIEGVTLSITTTENVLPYSNVDPARAFSSDGVADGDLTTEFGGTNTICGPGQLGTLASPCVNGTGSNIISQTDANTNFEGVQQTEVPEPATLTLLGVGLLGAAAARRRAKKNQK